jgi:hypothetical protein
MQIATSVYGSEHAGAGRRRRLWVLLAWAGLVGLLLLRHAYWRDEVRALSMALQGDTVIDMLRMLRGEGHPAVWYLLLRGAHAVLPTNAVLPLVSTAVALAAALLLVWRSPFGWPVVAALLLGRIGLYEYSVMARNYGISMLLMFVFASLCPRHRDRGVVLGLVLLVLANTNVHSALLAGALLVFWLLDVVLDRAVDRPRVLRNLATNALLAGVGMALGFFTVYPPFNDAAQSLLPAGDPLRRLAMALFLPAASFWELVGLGLQPAVRMHVWWPAWFPLVSQLLMSAVLIGSALGLAHRPAALVSALLALLGFSAFFAMVYPGFYRHQALWLVLLVTLYWIAGRGEPAAEPPALRRLRAVGMACFLGLLLLQVATGLQRVLPIALGSTVESRSRELAALIEQTPSLRNATIMADPDYLVEALPYYLPNPTYLPRQGEFGRYVRFTKDARLSLYLRDILEEARQVRRTTGEPVVILLHERLDPSGPVRRVDEGYNWQLWTSPGQVREFLSATRHVARFEPTCCNDESYDVYVLE